MNPTSKRKNAKTNGQKARARDRRLLTKAAKEDAEGAAPPAPEQPSDQQMMALAGHAERAAEHAERAAEHMTLGKRNLEWEHWEHRPLGDLIQAALGASFFACFEPPTRGCDDDASVDEIAPAGGFAYYALSSLGDEIMAAACAFDLPDSLDHLPRMSHPECMALLVRLSKRAKASAELFVRLAEARKAAQVQS